MSTSKLRTMHVVIIGSFACILVIAGLYFLVIKKHYEEIDLLNTRLATARNEYAQMATVERQLEEAQQRNLVLSSKYERYLSSKMPPITFEDRALGMIGLWREQSETLGPLIQGWPNRSGVSLLSEIQVPAAPVNPNAINTTLIQIPIGSLQVRGDFVSILSHLRSWNNFNRLVQIDPAALSGQSPSMTAQYNLTVYILPRGDQPGPEVAMAGGAQGADFGMGMPAMGAPGMGGPPGMPPSPGVPPGAPPGGGPIMPPPPPPSGGGPVNQ